MAFISISIDICGSTKSKSDLRRHSKNIKTDEEMLYDSFQRQVLHVEDTFWTMIQSSGLQIERLFLLKSIGDEIWYSYDLNELHKYESRAAIAKMIGALISLQTKHFHLVAGPPEDPYNWEDVDSDKLMMLDLPLKITVNVISKALDVGTIREKYLAAHVPSLLSLLGKPIEPVQAGDDRYINLCNRLGIANQFKLKDKVLSSIRSDFIGWEIDRFFRLTKAAIEGTVLIGPEILADFEDNNLFVKIGEDIPDQGRWSLTNLQIRISQGSGSFTTLGTNYILAKREMPAEEQKGVGEECNIGIVYLNYQQGIVLS